MPEALVVRGSVRVRRRDLAGLEDVARGIEIARESGRLGGIVQQHLTAAGAYMAAGKLERTEELIAGAAAMMDLTGERSPYEPQLAAFKAALLLRSRSSDLAEVDRLLQSALAGWSRYQSPWMELQTLRVYAEVALRTGNVEPARARLAKCYAGFREGFETRALRDARRLLTALGAS